MEDKDKRRESQRKYRESHKVEAKAYNAARKEKMKSYSVQYRKENAKALKDQKDEYYQKNSETLKSKIKVWGEKNPDKVKGYKEKYYQDNIEKVKKKSAKASAKDRAKFLESKRSQISKQKNLCDLCDLPLPSDITKCNWDHNHSTGEMRGVLHARCNQLVGAVEDEFHKAAIAYVRRHDDRKTRSGMSLGETW